MSNAEAERQRLFVEALLAPKAGDARISTREQGARALRGLQAYRANANASAERALATAYPTVQQLLGDDNFRHLAGDFWRAVPPLHGDLGEWGAGLAAWISDNEALATWPYLTDCARLDWALHVCERAQDSALDAESLARLADTDPWRLAVDFAAGLSVIEAGWPIAAIHAAHREADDALFEVAREAIAQQHAESVVVSRRGWKACVFLVDAPTVRWTRRLLDGMDLDAALQDAGPSWDFAAWLARAVESQWLKGIRVLGD